MNISAVLPFAVATSGMRFSQANPSAQTEDKTKVGGDIQSVAAINTPQFFADRAKRAASIEETTPQNFQNSRDAGKPHSRSGDVLDLSSDMAVQAESESAAEYDTVHTGNTSEVKTETQAQVKTAEKLTPEEQEQVSKLKSRDAEVRAHEAAHLAAAGQFAKGGASFTYQTGPDGRRYAIGGEVSIDSGPVKGDPAATIQKAQQVQAAALAPANPSSQDQKVAAAAAKMMATAQAELAKQQGGQGQTDSSSSSTEMGTSSTTSAESSDSVEISAAGQTASGAKSGMKSGANSSTESLLTESLEAAGTKAMTESETAKKSVSGIKSATELAESSAAAVVSSVATLKMAQTQYRMMGASWDMSPNRAGRFQVVG